MTRYDDPNDGFGLQPHRWHEDHKPGYAKATAPHPAPAGTRYVPELGTYVDEDVAAQLGLAASAAQADSEAPEFPGMLIPGVNMPADGEDTPRQEWIEPEPEITHEELEDLQAEIQERSRSEASPSSTYTVVAEHLSPTDLAQGMEQLIAGDFNGVVERIANATGLAPEMAVQVIQTSVEEVSPYAAEQIGDRAWSSLLYAATSTPDPLARKVVADLVSGRLHPSKLPRAYALWYESLPDAD
jgi:hypothetical protein